MNQDKRVLRRSIKKIISQIPEEIFNSKSIQLGQNILKFLAENNFNNQKTVLGAFAPLPDEVHWQMGMKDLKASLAFPGIIDSSTGEMGFFKSSLDQLQETEDFGVKVSTPPVSASLITPQLLLIPGLSFSKDGHRLGRGKGFFDKYLENYKGYKIGICFAEQISSEIPVESHDELVDYVITDEDIWEVAKK